MIINTILSKDDSQIDQVIEFKKKIQEKHVVVYVNKFDEASAKSFFEDFSKAHQSGQSVIPIVIDSYGGAVDSLVTMIDVIKSSKIPVATICVGKAMSCGSVLLSCGDEGRRFISPTSRVMIHHVSNLTYGKVEGMKVKVEETERLQKEVFRIMAENCGKHESYFLDLISDNLDLYLSPDECLKHNLVNHIKIPQFETKISITTELA